MMIMNFDKVISNMQELQSKIKLYEEKNKKIEDTLSSLKKEILKLEKKKTYGLKMKKEVRLHITKHLMKKMNQIML